MRQVCPALERIFTIVTDCPDHADHPRCLTQPLSFVRRIHNYQEEDIDKEKEQRKEDYKKELQLSDWFNPQ